MLLKSLSIRGLYRTLNLDVVFNEELTLLVGINGSGKTSVLNVIDWLLKPDIRKLVFTRYDSLTLKFTEGNNSYILAARKTPRKLTLSIRGAKTRLKPITASLTGFDPEDDDVTKEARALLRPEKHELPMFELLKSFSKPTVILLDRTVSAEAEEVTYVEELSGLPKRRKSPIDYVQDVTSSRYAEFRTQAIANDNELKANIVISALQDPETAFRSSAIKMTPAEITKLEEKVSTYLSATIKSTDVRRQVRSFFHASRVFTREQAPTARQRSFVFDFISAQYRQIESLAKAFNDFEKKNALAFRSLYDYLATVNRFFSDSGKELFFDESTGKLAFSVRNSPDEKVGRAIALLSSGERQILVLFTFLAFSSNPKSVFMVDEPELSLHPKWQSDFMEAFLRLRPAGTQLLLATHSPDIVGKYKDKCVALRGSRP
jgi:predicted ATP-dependent endonuclease of OLD family